MIERKHMMDKKQAGFTLVELAIVMIIIGLLIGGVLKGQELIKNAEISATISQVKAFDAAFGGFRDQFAAVPGDMSAANATARIPNCAAVPCNRGGNGNGTVDQTPGALLPAAAEGRTAWVQLQNAGYIPGLNANNVPDGKIGGEFVLGYHAGGNLPADVGGGSVTRSHFVTLNGTAAAGDAPTAVTSATAARIDRKLDDGVANTGTMQSGALGAAACATAAGVYNEATDTASCEMAFGLSN